MPIPYMLCIFQAAPLSCALLSRKFHGGHASRSTFHTQPEHVHVQELQALSHSMDCIRWDNRYQDRQTCMAARYSHLEVSYEQIICEQ